MLAARYRDRAVPCRWPEELVYVRILGEMRIRFEAGSAWIVVFLTISERSPCQYGDELSLRQTLWRPWAWTR